MTVSHSIASRSSSFVVGTITRAEAGPDDQTAEPSLTSGFGAVLEHEHELKASVAGYIGTDESVHADAIDRILQNQQDRLSANIALLQERYEMLPHPSRFDALRAPLTPPSKARYTRTELRNADMLPTLVAQHRKMMGDIATLIAQRADGQRGELILGEVARNHEEMAWMLMALLNEDAVRDRVTIPVVGVPVTTVPEGNWENEGGALQAKAS